MLDRVYVADQVVLNLTLSETPKLGFLTSWPIYMCVYGVGVLFLLVYVFFLCLRAPRKIDSSIGLPSLNKVVTYLLTYLLTFNLFESFQLHDYRNCLVKHCKIQILFD